MSADVAPRIEMFRIDHDHPCLPGHFPGRPIVPGVLLLERALEAIEASHGAIGALRLSQVKFARPLLPGEDARIELVSVGAGDGLRWRFRVVHADGGLLASGEVVAA